MKILVFAGAGTSVDLGVPGMRRMLEQFFAHLRDLALPKGVIEAMENIVSHPSRDMEYAIDLVDRVEAGQRAEIELGRQQDQQGLLPYQTIRGEAEWFVQHCCEQLKAASAAQLWGPLLRTASETPDTVLSLATTNYDRAIEIAASRVILSPLEDGFEDFAGREFAEWTGTWTGKTIGLFKLHGSTDWYRGEHDRIIKLRHPMPLFGGLRVMPKESDKAVSSALVLPSREKIVTHPPFQEISYGFRQKANDADMLIFVGSSLRDPHIRDVCRKHAPNKPTFVVSRSGSFSADVLPSTARIIRESASRFLISTLPGFVTSGNIKLLENSTTRTGNDDSSVLHWLITAKDESARTIDRCDAIERLAYADVPLLKEELVSLVTGDDVEVSTFALGLVQKSADRDAIVEMEHGAADNDQTFVSELALLQSLK